MFETISYTEVEFEGSIVLLHAGVYFKGCKRCGGTGHYSFNGYDSICYNCNNSPSGRLGDELGTEADARKWAHKRELARQARIRAEERRVAKLVAALDAKVAYLRTVDNEVVEFLLAIDLNSYEDRSVTTFVRDMAEHVQYPSKGEKVMTGNMIAAVRKIIERNAEKAAVKAALPPVVEGRRVVTGKVVSTKAVEGDYGTSYKMLVEEADGTRVFGSIASSLWDDVQFLGSYRKLAWNETDGVMTKLVGMEVTFTATVEASRDDKSFGFFKRPIKASIVEGE